MKQTLMMLLMLAVLLPAAAQDYPESNLFAMNQTLNFDSLEQLTAYIKDHKPSTYRYYERLNTQAKKRVLNQHQADQQLDLTEVVLQEYRQRPR
ncbi:hypothetical protein [Marinicella meishanensis]|uniref:hypothetical protein n=1 Tax=Marinicella meishanensis TaxID=2873263 RepID=UPI001CC109C6|nr:hypothetical protein [Marinicella sp. NBU2979]